MRAAVVMLAATAAGLALLANSKPGGGLQLTAPDLKTGNYSKSKPGSGWVAAITQPISAAVNTINAEVSTVENYSFSQPSYPRGIRNNNPGNIRLGDNWRGMTAEQTDPAFIQFQAPEYGIRALGKLLVNYERLHGLNTVAGIINRWAPPTENNTSAYATHVAAQLGVPVNQAIDVKAALPKLVPAIIKHENGIQPYSADTIRAGLSLI